MSSSSKVKTRSFFFAAFVFSGVAMAGVSTPMPAEKAADAAEVIASAASIVPARFPDADVVVADDRIHTRYETDGSDVTWDDEWVKALTDRGCRQLSTVSVNVSRRYGDAEIQCVEIVGTNGVIRTVDFASTLREATDNSSAAANIYDPMDRVISCAVPGISVGEIRHVVTCRRLRKPRMEGAWFDINQLELTMPVARSVLTVDAPAELPIVREELRHPLADTCVRSPAVTNGSGRIEYRWTVRDVPQFFPEPRMPTHFTCVQALHVSTVGDWPTISRWYWKLCASHLAKTNAAMAAKVAELDVGDETARMCALYRFVAQEVRYMGLTLEDASPGYEPHDVDITFNRRYGVCRDKAALLVAMLRLAGFDAYPVLINAGTEMDRDVPCPYFNHAIVCVRRDGGDVLMDPTDDSSKDLLPSYLSGASYLVACPEGDTLRSAPVQAVEKNLLDVDTDVSLASDGSATVGYRVRCSGLNDNVFRNWFLSATPRERHDLFGGCLAKSVPGAELLSMTVTPADLRDIGQPLRMEATVRFPELVRRGDRVDVLRVPYLTDAVNFAGRFLANSFSLETRRFPISFSTTVGTRESVTVRYSGACGEPVDLPEPVALGGERLGYSTRLEYSCATGAVKVVREELLSTLRLPAEAYGEVRLLRERAEELSRGELRFASARLVNSDIRHLSRVEEYDVLSPYEWVKTNTFVKEVLTYEGKRMVSEMVFGFNPAVCAVEVVSAVVSNRNGTVRSVSPHETNELDADWVAAAPRYPSARTKIVNLPGVEIGSVISTVVARVVTNSPSAFSGRLTLDSDEASDYREIIFRVPANLDFRLDCEHTNGLALTSSHRRLDDGRLEWRFVRRTESPHLGEPNSPPGALWRPSVFFSSAPIDELVVDLSRRLKDARESGSEAVRAATAGVIAGIDSPADRIRAIRKFLVQSVRRIQTDGIFSQPREGSHFSPDRSLADGYASASDYANLLRTMLEAAGFEVELCLAASVHERQLSECAMDHRSLAHNGNFVLLAEYATGLWPFSSTSRYIVDLEANEYQPPECSQFAGASAYSVDRCRRLVLDRPTSDWKSRGRRSAIVRVRENGAVDVDYEEFAWGVGVGAFRKRYVEMRPEVRHRHELGIATSLARNADITRELVTDVESYPCRSAISLFSERYANIQGDIMTVSLPLGFRLAECLPETGRGRRIAPVAVRPVALSEREMTVVFPAGWTEVESLPASMELRFPGDDRVWGRVDVRAEIGADGLLRVKLTSSSEVEEGFVVPAELAPAIREWRAYLNDPIRTTISVRRTAGPGANGVPSDVDL